MGDSIGEGGNAPGIVLAVEGRCSDGGSGSCIGEFIFSLIMGGASFGGGGGGNGGGISVPAVRDSEREASNFGSLNRDVGVRFGMFAVASSSSML